MNLCLFSAHNLAQEHVTLREEIEQLKTGLEQAQMERRRKIEYDQVAEKINTLPTREELDLYASFCPFRRSSELLILSHFSSG